MLLDTVHCTGYIERVILSISVTIMNSLTAGYLDGKKYQLVDLMLFLL